MTPAQLSRAVDAAAIAAHDRLYDIGANSSDMSLMFEPAEQKQVWREVVLAALAALEAETPK